MINIWEINSRRRLYQREVLGTKVYEIQDIFQYPGQVLNYFRSRSAQLWKYDQRPSRNGHDFVDRRHKEFQPQLSELEALISVLVDQAPQVSLTIGSNSTRLLSNDYNNTRINSHYWWPHRDAGYTAIIYFDRDKTNIYRDLELDPQPLEGLPEHADPWRPKQYYELIDQLEGDINKMIVFDGSKLCHGMAIESNSNIFQSPRFNLCMFFQPINA